jgi:hypothetical protein
MEEYYKLKRMVEEVGEDVLKAVGGNKAAGTRVRKAMQEIKNTAQLIRQKVLEIRDAEHQPGPGASLPASGPSGAQPV